MSAKTHHLLTSGQVRGLYGCGFHWWVLNPGKSGNSWHDRRFVHMRFQGIHNKMNYSFGFQGPQVRTVLLDGYLQHIWRNGLGDAMEPAAVALDSDVEYRYDREYRSHMERFRGVWTPYGSLAQAVNDPAAAEWRGREDLVAQLGCASPVLERQKDVKAFLVRDRFVTRYDDGRHAAARDNMSVSLLLFERWQWASLHAALYSLCVPFMNGAPE